nr:MAG TPA: hypothetical protein [Caudoviricetes sp.]
MSLGLPYAGINQIRLKGQEISFLISARHYWPP